MKKEKKARKRRSEENWEVGIVRKKEQKTKLKQEMNEKREKRKEKKKLKKK